MRQIKMLKLAAGPGGTYLKGQKYDVPRELQARVAMAFCSTGAAVECEVPEEAIGQAEVADAPLTAVPEMTVENRVDASVLEEIFEVLDEAVAEKEAVETRAAEREEALAVAVLDEVREKSPIAGAGPTIRYKGGWYYVDDEPMRKKDLADKWLQVALKAKLYPGKEFVA